MSKCYIVAANRSGASVFESVGPKSEWVVRHRLSHPEGRKRSHDIDSDRAGSVVDSSGGGYRNMEREQKATEHESAKFAKEIAELLRADRVGGAFEDLVLVAPPHFLGQLRSALDPATARVLAASVAKDLPEPKPETLRALLADQISV